MVWISAFPNDKQDHMGHGKCILFRKLWCCLVYEKWRCSVYIALLFTYPLTHFIKRIECHGFISAKVSVFFLHCFLYIILRVDEQPTWLSMTPNSSNLLALCLFIVHNAKMCVTCSNWIELTDDFFCIQQRVSQPAIVKWLVFVYSLLSIWSSPAHFLRFFLQWY